MSELGGAAPRTLTTTPAGSEASRPVLSTTIDRYLWVLLGLLVVIGAIIRAHAFSSGTLFQDDAWVAMTNQQSLSTAAHMTVSAPGFMLFERFWTGLLPHSTWWAQLPSYLASVAGIFAVFALVRYFRFSAWTALLCAAILTVSNEAISVATHLKPYPFDLLIACALLWLGERVRRAWTLRSFALLAIASVLACGWSFILVLVVIGIDFVLGIIVLRRRSMTWAAFATGGTALLIIGVFYEVVIRPQVTLRLRAYWRPDNLQTGSLHALARSIESMVHGILRTQLSVPTSHAAIGVVATAEATLLAVALIVGVVISWRRCALAIGVLLATLVAWTATVIPLGSDRTEAYLFPALLLLVAGGIEGSATSLRRHAPRAVSRGGAAVLALGTVLIIVVAILSPPTYRGGALPRPSTLFGAGAVAHHTVVIVEPGTVYPWVYVHDPTATIVFSPQFSTGFNFRSSEDRVILLWDHPGNARFNRQITTQATPSITRLVTVGYVSAFDEPQHQATTVALRALCWTPSGTTVAKRYRVTTFTRLVGCSPSTAGERVGG